VGFVKGALVSAEAWVSNATGDERLGIVRPPPQHDAALTHWSEAEQSPAKEIVR
jgi:hypothetical protein